MRKRFYPGLMALCMMLTLLLSGTAFAAESAATIYCADSPGGTALMSVKSNNRNDNTYSAYDASTVKSYLYQDGSNLVRVEYVDEQIVVETYTNDFQLISSRSMDMDLGFTKWGGFYAGEDYNFVIVGQGNPEENNSVEVIRVIQYDKEWNRLGQAGLYGANTIDPFSFGSLRCDEYCGMLYIHTCHRMYASSDGLNHQANMILAVRQSDMTITDAQYSVSNSYGYVSHSFNQIILIDQDCNIVTLDHGDVYPRAAVLQRYSTKAGNEKFASRAEEIKLQSFPDNDIQYQQTGASLGGLSETSSAYITVYNYDGVGGGSNSYTRNVYLTYTPKDSFSEASTSVTQITSYSSGGTYSAGTPILVPTSLDDGYILWDVREQTAFGGYNTADKISYVTYSANGNISDIKTVTGTLSDCQPILYNGKVVWYVTDNSTPTFYTLDESGLAAYRTMPEFDDVDSGSWYYDAVRFVYTNGLMDSQGNADAFVPDTNADRGTIVSALYQLEDSVASLSSEFSDVSGGLVPAVSWASACGIVNGYGDGRFGPDDSVTREQFAAILYRYARYKGYDTTARANLSGYTDQAQISSYAVEAMQWANAEGLITGVTNATLVPAGTATRAEVATILMRFCEKIAQ